MPAERADGGAAAGDAAGAGRRDRAIGALVGLACGDAVGTTLEFKRPGTFAPIDDMVGGGPFRLRPGEWTDDTSMALCLAESLLDRGDHDPADQMRRYVRWSREGYLSSNGDCFDIGNTVSAQLRRFERTGEAVDPAPDEESAANGSLMRLAPVPPAGCWARGWRRGSTAGRPTRSSPPASGGGGRSAPRSGQWPRARGGPRRRRRCGAPATASTRSRRPSGPWRAPVTSATPSCGPPTWATTPTRPPPSPASSPAPGGACRASRPSGGRSW